MLLWRALTGLGDLGLAPTGPKRRPGGDSTAAPKPGPMGNRVARCCMTTKSWGSSLGPTLAAVWGGGSVQYS